MAAASASLVERLLSFHYFDSMSRDRNLLHTTQIAVVQWRESRLRRSVLVPAYKLP
jgi:hypothetical protein